MKILNLTISVLILFGSSLVYAENGYIDLKYLTENYGMAKVSNFVALRYFNVYGPGEEHKGKMASVAYQAYQKGEFKLFPKKTKKRFCLYR